MPPGRCHRHAVIWKRSLVLPLSKSRRLSAYPRTSCSTDASRASLRPSGSRGFAPCYSPRRVHANAHSFVSFESRLSLLNTTVAQLAKTVNNVLTMAYRDIYGDEDGEDPAQLMLLTAPLSASDEIANLYTAGLIPIEVAMPAAMHAVGVGKDAIERVTREAKEREEKKKTCADCVEEAGKIGLELQNEKQKLDIEEKRNRIHASEEAGRQKTNGSDSEDGVELSERTGEE